MEGRYNTRSPAVKRLMREAQELSEPTDQYYAQPLEDNLFEWHFTVRGPADSDFQSGIYHGRIILPVDYPMKPPSIIWLTPNGRFETNKKICLSISGHHPESWQPSWSIRTALLAIIGFMPTRPGGAIGSLDYTPEERKVLAKKSQDWKCQACGSINQILLERSVEQPRASQEAKDLAAQIQFQGEKPKAKEGEGPGTSSTAARSSAAAASTTSSPTDTSATAATSGSNQQQQQPQVLHQPPFPHWNFPGGVPIMPPGFPPPMAWPANNGGNPLAMIPRFPYPPSQQPMGSFPVQYFPPGFPPMSLHGMGMFPVPPTFQGPVSPQIVADNNTVTPVTQFQLNQISVNNSSVASEGSAAQSSVSSTGKETTTNEHDQIQSGSSQSALPRAAEKENVDTRAAHQSTSGDDKDKSKCTRFETAQQTIGAAGHDSSQEDVESKGSEIMGGASFHKDRGEGTEQSQLDLPADKASDDDNSYSGIPPLDFSEGEQRSSYLERSVSSSVPDLEKQSRPGQKGLRHRQSATATVPTSEAGEEGSQVGESTNSAGGQRIEAASGDTHPRLLRTHHPPRAFLEARVAHRNALVRSTQQPTASQYDGSFFAMLVLGIATALILLNRLVRMVDWSVIL